MNSLCIDQTFFAVLTASFTQAVGRPLVTPGRDAAWLYEQASFVVLAHDTRADPRFFYANRAAQDRFGYSWDELVGMPSRLSAEMPERAERERLLAAVSARGFIANYQGVRVTKSGQRFRMTDGIVWELLGDHGQRLGQAATFSSWTDL